MMLWKDSEYRILYKKTEKTWKETKNVFQTSFLQNNENTSILNTKHDFKHIKAQNTHKSLTIVHKTNLRHF
jgi:hypothetical protein